MSEQAAPIRVISFLLLAACGVLCQEHPSSNLDKGLRFEAANSGATQRQEVGTWKLLPEAPSPMLPSAQTERFHGSANEASLPLTLSAGGIRKTEPRYAIPGAQPSLSALSRMLMFQKESSAYSGKHLNSPLLTQNPADHPLSSDKLMDRAFYAASRTFIARDESGRTRVNTAYFLRVLSSVALHSAQRPYWARSGSEAFSDFRSTIGSDAGINVLHEFDPGLRQITKHFTPKFMSRIEERITHSQTNQDAFLIPSR
jgi:hypothetical protein